MNWNFERGDESAPKGHALVYFRSVTNSSEVLASYLIVLPIPLNVTKYLPPLFAAQASQLPPSGIAAFPFPPVPEVMESHQELQFLAEIRDDDIIFGGTINSEDIEGALQVTNDILQQYQSLYSNFKGNRPSEKELAGGSVDEVLFSLLGEKDKLAEISKLVGKIRFGVSAGDSVVVKEGIDELHSLGGYLAEGYKLSLLVDVAQIPGSLGDKLSELYLRRCYNISDEDYRGLAETEQAIKSLDTERA